jgi:hypothetical protein
MAIGTLSASEVSALLGDLRDGLNSDGYDLRVSSSADKLELDIVVAREDACADCLVPKEIMAQIAAMAIQEKHSGVTADDIVLRYPAEH